MDPSYVIIGGGGHALSIADALSRCRLPLLGYTAPGDDGELLPGVGWLGDDGALASLSPDKLRLVNGIGSSGRGMTQRRDAYLRLRDAGFAFADVRHPNASVSPLLTQLGPAHQVLAAAVINAAVHCGENVLINTGAIVEHGCRIGSHCHLASGAVLCGDVALGDSVHVGAGATIIQGLTVGSGAVIAAGAVITQNVEPLTLVAGVPAKPIRKLHA
jgi:sugar O-acyltransferase (sialic acid O-acetyltransferase NeuD family)